MRRVLTVSALCCFVGLVTSPANAQILIWNLPAEDGAWVRFEGTYRQTQARPESNAGDEVLEWRSELTISSVGAEQALFQGTEVPCRWVEFKSITKANDLEKQPGPGGVRLYKVLIPESRVIGKLTDEEGIPATFLPIVKGYRKVGAREVEPVSERALAVYPTIAPLTYYPDLQPAGDPAEVQLPGGGAAVSVQVFKGTRVLQSNQSRSTNVGVLSRTDEVPFGLARFQVNLTREEKAPSASADEFRRVSQVEVDMAVVAQGASGAKSELPESR